MKFFSAFLKLVYGGFAIQKRACFAHWRLKLMGALQKLNCPVQKSISAMLLGDGWHPLRPCWRFLWYLSCRDAFGAAVVAVEDGVVDRHVHVTSMNIHVRTFGITIQPKKP